MEGGGAEPAPVKSRAAKQAKAFAFLLCGLSTGCVADI
jgi:hypothetical protein